MLFQVQHTSFLLLELFSLLFLFCQPTVAQNENKNSSPLLTTNIPPTFSVESSQIAGRAINKIRFYENCIAAVARESRFDFFTISPGYQGHDGKNDFYILPQSEYPRMLHANVVWAVQRVAEDITRSQRYEEIVGNIYLGERRGSEIKKYRLGVITMRGMTTEAPAIASGQGEEDYEGGVRILNITDLEPSSANAQTLELPPGYTAGDASTQSNGIMMRVTYPPAAQVLEPGQLLLALVITLACIAEHSFESPAQAFGNSFSESGIPVTVTLVIRPEYKDGLTYKNLVTMVSFLAEKVIDGKTWSEVDGRLGKVIDEGGQQVLREIGRLEWRKITEPGSNGVGGEIKVL